MRQLQKNKLKNVYWIIVCLLSLSMFLFYSCSTPKNQNVQDHSINKAKGETTNSEAIEKIAKDKRSVEAIQFIQSPNSSEVLIKGNKDLKYTSIKQSFPFGIAIYLSDTRIDENVVSIVPKSGSISNIIPSYADKDKKTTKIEILLNKDLPYTIEKESGDLRVTISNEHQIVQSGAKKINSQKKSTKVTKKIQIPKGIAKLSNIEFNVEDEGNTKLTIVTSHPVNYDFSKGSKGILYLNLYKTDIPNRHKRPFETKYFKSAVYKISPIQQSSSNKNSKIEISMREKVPYHVVQSNNTIIVHFEPSSIEPPKFTKADKTESINKAENSNEASENLNQHKPKFVENSDASSKPALRSTSKTKSAAIETPVAPMTKKLTPQEKEYNDIIGQTEYTGEKIKLDFYETDIKNVFRILSGISNKNFAIDKNVTGSVTLTLDNPIPWDQVLDLILAMNQLGKIKTGEVIRIATQSTLASEAKQKQDKFEAIQSAKEAQKALQPIVTEYIPINYADASKDIMPHIEQILTPKRGSVSVDSRTNIVIISDTRDVVNRVKHLIYTLDNVTPQIMIRAKIVEANRDFSRTLGLNTNLGFNELNNGDDDLDDSPPRAHGFDDYLLNVNNAGGLSSIGLTFNNLLHGAFGGNISTAFLNLQLNAAETKGDVEVLSSPKILTLDNVKATIKQGIEYPYYKSDGDGNTTIEYKNVDLLLEVTPHVTPDKRISMELYITKNEIAGFKYDAPSLSINEAKTTLLINNNDTIVIGGVLKTKSATGKSGFPILMNVPILGRLFRTDLDTNDKQELLIFITPTIIQLKQRKTTLSSDQDFILD